MNVLPSTRNALGMPPLGFGTYQLSTEQARACVQEALRAGFRHIDSAEGYANESGTGEAIKAVGMPRDELFVTTKVFPGYAPWGTQEKDYKDTVATLKRQLLELQLDHVDLYLIHAPFSKLRLEQWRACVELKKQGLTRHIGVANYNRTRIQEMLDAGLSAPEANQIEFHPLCSQPELSEFMRAQNIEPVAYSSLAPLSTWRTEEGQGGEVLAETKAVAQSVIQTIAEKLEVSEAALLLRWGMQEGYSVLTKSSKPERIKENLGAYGIDIPEDDMRRLRQLNQNQALAWAANGMNPMDVADPLDTEHGH